MEVKPGAASFAGALSELVGVDGAGQLSSLGPDPLQLSLNELHGLHSTPTPQLTGERSLNDVAKQARPAVSMDQLVELMGEYAFAREIDPTVPIREMGMDSLAAASFAGALSELVGFDGAV